MDWSRIRHFKAEEFACPCCGRSEMSQEFLDRLDLARKACGFPLQVTSGFRCEAHNAAVGGKPDSAHLRGLAADVACPDSRSSLLLVRALLDAGIHRIGVAKGCVHRDSAADLPWPALWLY